MTTSDFNATRSFASSPSPGPKLKAELRELLAMQAEFEALKVKSQRLLYVVRRINNANDLNRGEEFESMSIHNVQGLTNEVLKEWPE